MKLKIIFNSNSILTPSAKLTTTKVTPDCDNRTMGEKSYHGAQNGHSGSFASDFGGPMPFLALRHDRQGRMAQRRGKKSPLRLS
jgi:hypothetical protein